MYTLFKERYYTDKDGVRHHECKKKEFELLDDAQEEMVSDFDKLRLPEDDAFILKRSFILLRGSDRNKEMILYGIL